MKSTVLIVSSNPKNTSFLRLDRELRIIQDVIQKSILSDRIDIQVAWAVRTIDLLAALQRHQPWIVHFCGHGEGQAGLALEDETGQKTTLSNTALTEIAAQFADTIECVLLNACYSKVQAGHMSEHINYVIGMSNAIEDKAALAFTRGFYTALGGGETISSAYRFGRSQIAIEFPTDFPNDSISEKSPVTERKAIVVNDDSSQSTGSTIDPTTGDPTTGHTTAANLAPLLFQKETLTTFDKDWMTAANQSEENAIKEAVPPIQQPTQKQTNTVSGITFGAGNTTFNFSPVQANSSHVTVSTQSPTPPTPPDSVTSKQALQAAIAQLTETVSNDAAMNPLLKQGALSQLEQTTAALQKAELDDARLQQMISDLTQGLASSPSLAAAMENVTWSFSLWLKSMRSDHNYD